MERLNKIEMTLRDFINIIPKEYDDYIEGIEYDGSDVDFKLTLSIESYELAYTFELTLFSDGTYGVYNLNVYDREEQKETKAEYIPSEFIDVVHGITIAWRTRENTC